MWLRWVWVLVILFDHPIFTGMMFFHGNGLALACATVLIVDVVLISILNAINRWYNTTLAAQNWREQYRSLLVQAGNQNKSIEKVGRITGLSPCRVRGRKAVCLNIVFPNQERARYSCTDLVGVGSLIDKHITFPGAKYQVNKLTNHIVLSLGKQHQLVSVKS